MRVAPLQVFHDGGSYHIEANPLICSANQWIGFYKIEISVIKKLKLFISQNLKANKVRFSTVGLSVVLCAIWYHSHNLINVKNTHGGVLLLLKITLLHGCFSRFLNCAHGIKSRNAPQTCPLQ